MEGPVGEPWAVKLCASHFPTLNLSLFVWGRGAADGASTYPSVPGCGQMSNECDEIEQRPCPTVGERPGQFWKVLSGES